MSAKKTRDASRSDVLLDQTVAMLAPLIRVLAAQGVTYPQLAVALKPAFLRAARAELAQSGKRINDSAISIVSGVHRKDVRALSSQSGTTHEREPLQSLADEVANRWVNDPDYLGQDGLPLALPVRTGSAQSEPSFERLSQSVTRDFHSRAVLDELVRLGRIEIRDDIARLDQQRAIADRSFVLTMDYIARNVHDHLAAIEGNFSAAQTVGGGLPHLEHSAAAENLSPESIQTLQELARRVLESSKRRISALTEKCVERDSQHPGSQALRMRLGMYFYSEPESPLIGGDVVPTADKE